LYEGLALVRQPETGERMVSVGPPGRLLVPLVLVGILIACSASCGDDYPGVSGTDLTPPLGSTCATPQEGCECAEEGKVIDCGKVARQSGDYVSCTYGYRQCVAGHWGDCRGTDLVSAPKAFVGGQILPTALSPDAGACTNPCDPFCAEYPDTPASLDAGPGFQVDPDGGGLVVGPNTDGGGSVGGGQLTWTSNPAGVTNCSPNRNLIESSCTAPDYGTCQQDSRCEATASKCIWNGGPGYYDHAAPGPDLTVGAPCGVSGSSPPIVPFCNRGTGTVPVGSTITFHTTNGSNPPNGCTNLGPPTCSYTLSSALGPGQCAAYVYCTNTLGAKFVTINAGPTPIAEAAGRCANNSAYSRNDGAPGCGFCAACDTRVTGKVYDPSGAPPTSGANNIPLAGITVFQPAGPLTTFTDGVACDSCSSLSSPMQTSALTDATGSFTLDNVSPGTSVPIVVQSGRWRRRVNIPVTACALNTPAAGTFKMPKDRTEGDIPKIALIQNNYDPLECWLRKVGVAASEILPRTNATVTSNRIDLFRSSGMSTSPTATSGSNLLNSYLNQYAAVMMGCDVGGVVENASNTQKTRVRDWADDGGRLFLTDLAGDYMVHDGANPWPSTATWYGGSSTVSLPARGHMYTTTAPQILFRDWMSNVGGSTDYGFGTMRSDEAYRRMTDPLGISIGWIRGQSNNNWGSSPNGNYLLSYSFDTPFNASPTCGRVIFNAIHTSPVRVSGGVPVSSSKTFPGSCQLGAGMTSEEKALEYQFFQLTACALGGDPPPTPPTTTPPPLTSQTFIRDYEAVCEAGAIVEWAYFSWQTDIPAGTSIAFRAATADTQAALPAIPGDVPTSANIGTANTTVPVPPAPPNPQWGRDADTVNVNLQQDTGQSSKRFLRVFMTFNPTATVSPTLKSWRQEYRCVPNE
jgi:hypothetical protein